MFGPDYFFAAPAKRGHFFCWHYPLESTGSASKIARIEFGGASPFYLEYRRGIGFDGGLNNFMYASNQNGLFVNEYNDYLLDMSPTTDLWPEDSERVTLNIGESFIDERRRIQIGPVISATPEAITFDVLFNFNPPIYDWWDLF